MKFSCDKATGRPNFPSLFRDFAPLSGEVALFLPCQFKISQKLRSVEIVVDKEFHAVSPCMTRRANHRENLCHHFSPNSNCFHNEISKTSLFNNGKTALCNFQLKITLYLVSFELTYLPLNSLRSHHDKLAGKCSFNFLGGTKNCWLHARRLETNFINLDNILYSFLGTGSYLDFWKIHRK